MPSGKWFPAPKDGDSDGEQPDSFVSMSTVEDLSYTPSQDEKNRDAEQIAATGRRSWKTLKGRGEAVWPPMLEGALIEALKEYKKMEAPPTASKHGYRFPMRNRFVSDFIYTKTGKTRTAKQVGSRLQQLRDTCRDPALAALLGRGPDQCKQERSPTPDHDSGSAAGSPAPSARPSPIIIYMQIEFPTQSSGPIDRVPRVPFERNDIQTPHFIYLLPAPQQVFSTDNRTSALSLYANLVDIVAHLPLQLDAVWTVYRHSTAVYSETSHIRPMASNSNAYRYSCELVPSSWSRLCQFPAEDLNDITIVQVLKPVPGAQAASSSLAGAIPMSASSPEGDISIVYHFNYPVTSRLGKSSKATMLHHSPSPESPTSSSSPSPPAPGYSGSSGYEDQGMSQYSSGYWPAGSSNSPYHGHSAVSPFTLDSPISTTEGRSYGLYPQRVEGYGSAEGYGGGRYELPDATMSSFYEEPRASSWMTPQPLMLPLTDGGRRESLAYGREDSYY